MGEITACVSLPLRAFITALPQGGGPGAAGRELGSQEGSRILPSSEQEL